MDFCCVHSSVLGARQTGGNDQDLCLHDAYLKRNTNATFSVIKFNWKERITRVGCNSDEGVVSMKEGSLENNYNKAKNQGRVGDVGLSRMGITLTVNV